MTMTTFQTIAREFYRAFATENPRKVVSLVDTCEPWMRDAIYDAHTALDGRMPDDWTYEACREIVSALEELDDVNEDTAYEIADANTDNATADLTTWLASHVGNVALVDQAIEDFGLLEMFADARRAKRGADRPSLVSMIASGQLHAYRTLTESLINAIQSQATARDASVEHESW
jgi:hypothetical protein